jgi:hypothetical protein
MTRMVPQGTLWVALLLSMAIAFTGGCGKAGRSTDPDFLLLESSRSPDGRFVLLVYHYDAGAFGCSRL